MLLKHDGQLGYKDMSLTMLLQFKTQCEFNANDFEADKIEQYKYVREEMATFHD